MRKDKAVGILDLRSIGYFKVGYQKMVNMAESSKTFQMYHYQQIKCDTKTEDWSTSDQYMRVTGRYGNGKSKKIQDSEEQSEIGRRSVDQMERLVSLGILSKNTTSHTSPVMLITRKLTKDKRPVVDFRLLNTRILWRNTSIPLMSDVLSILGNSECEVVSCGDIKDAYHSISGILPYFGSPIYRYEVLPVGIACVPQIWMDYITLILSELEDKKKYITIMDDLLIHSTKVDHWKLSEQLLKSMCKNGLRLSPKKCQLFKTNLIYMGNEFTINRRTMTITPLRSRTEAINKIPTPRTPKQCKSFCGVVNYLPLFCPDLQKLLKSIVELTRKGRPFVWGEAQEKAFREVKLRLKNPPVLHLPKA